MYGNPYYYAPPNPWKIALGTAKSVGDLMQQRQQLQQEPQAFKQQQDLDAQRLQQLQLLNQMSGLKLQQEPQLNDATLALMQARLPNLQADTALTQEKTKLAPQTLSIAQQRLALQQNQLNSSVGRFGPMYQLKNAMSTPAGQAYVAQHPEFAQQFQKIMQGYADAVDTGQSPQVVADYQNQAQNLSQGIAAAMSQQGKPTSPAAVASSSPQPGYKPQVGPSAVAQPISAPQQPSEAALLASQATRAKLQKEVAPPGMQKQANQYQNLYQIVHGMNLAPLYKYAGYYGQAKGNAQKVMMGLSSIPGLQGLDPGQDFRDYSSLKTYMRTILPDKIRQAFGTSIQPAYVKQFVNQISDPSFGGYEDPHLMAQTFANFANTVKHSAALTTQAANQGVGTNLLGNYDTVTAPGTMEAIPYEVKSGQTTDLAPDEGAHVKITGQAPNVLHVKTWSPEEKQKYLEQHSGMSLSDLNEMLSRKGYR